MQGVFKGKFEGGNIGVLAGGRGVLGVYYLLENIIHYYYCQSEGGEDSSQGGEYSPFPPTRKYPACVSIATSKQALCFKQCFKS